GPCVGVRVPLGSAHGRRGPVQGVPARLSLFSLARRFHQAGCARGWPLDYPVDLSCRDRILCTPREAADPGGAPWVTASALTYSTTSLCRSVPPVTARSRGRSSSRTARST